jgi:hypothetical protein
MDENGQSGNAASAGRHSSTRKKVSIVKKFGVKRIVAGVIASVILVVVMVVGFMWYQSTMGANIDSSKFQAVFFTNGQVYFGKLQTLNGNYMKLTDIFYLQTKAADTSGNPQETSSQGTSDVQLIKLGNEIHGPVDEMIISKDQMLFFENLKSDGKVAKSIAEYQKK